MKIALLQTDIRWCSPEDNYRNIESMIEHKLLGDEAAHPVPDLVVLPEMFTTGFCTDATASVEKDGAKTLEWMRGIAAKYDFAFAGTIAVDTGGDYRNRFFFVKPDGTYEYYDKAHLYSKGGERRDFTPGNERVIVEWRGFRILLQVCYDLRFPVFARNRGELYDMIIYSASWTVSRSEIWKTLLKARAIENICYVAGVNRIGTDPFCDYDGSSIVSDFKGNVIAAARDNEQDVVYCELDKIPMEEFRAIFPALADADRFEVY